MIIAAIVFAAFCLFCLVELYTHAMLILACAAVYMLYRLKKSGKI